MVKIKDFEDQFKEISEKYIGVRKQDLNEMNPWYSCVICSKYYDQSCPRSFSSRGTGHACDEANPLEVEVFIAEYDFPSKEEI
jgi:hypothetical protein